MTWIYFGDHRACSRAARQFPLMAPGMVDQRAAVEVGEEFPLLMALCRDPIGDPVGLYVSHAPQFVYVARRCIDGRWVEERSDFRVEPPVFALQLIDQLEDCWPFQEYDFAEAFYEARLTPAQPLIWSRRYGRR